MKNIFLILVALIQFGIINAQKKIVLDISAGANIHYTNFKFFSSTYEKSDPFLIEKRNPRLFFPAFSIGVKYFLFKNKPNFYLTNQIQIQYNEYKYFVSQVPISPNSYQNFTFTSRNTNIGLYFGVGNRFYFGKKKKQYILVDGGFTFGIISESGQGAEVDALIEPGINTRYEFKFEDNFGNNFLCAFQTKIEIHPFSKLSNIGLGFMPSLNLTRSPKTIREGISTNLNTNFSQTFYGETNSWSANFYSYLSWSFYKPNNKKKNKQVENLPIEF